MSPDNESGELKALILENQRLLAENNELLKEMHRSAVRHLWFNIAWIVIFFGLPLIAFYHFIQPLYGSLGGQTGTLEGQLDDFYKRLEIFFKPSIDIL
jgi:hypothetical protein